MASTGSFPGGGLGSESVLDAPPPSPAQPPKQNLPAEGLGGLVGAAAAGGVGAANQSVPSGQQAPQVLDGIMKAGTQIGLMYDSFAQATPDLAPLLDACKEALQAYLGELMVAGAGPTGPTASGPNFPGGGFAGGPIPR